MFIKQHSVFDVSTAFMLAFVMYNVVYIKTGCICRRRAEASRIQQTARFVFDLIIAAFNSKRHHPEFTPVDVFYISLIKCMTLKVCISVLLSYSLPAVVEHLVHS